MNLEMFEVLARKRRAVRSFLNNPIEESLIQKLLTCAHWAPSGYNLQPTHYILVHQQETKEQLFKVCFKQRQTLEAPYILVFVGDTKAPDNHTEEVIKAELACGAINEKYAKIMKSHVNLAFKQGPLGLNWLWKTFLVPFLRFFTPIPNLPASCRKTWVDRQVMLAAMNFMLAATSAGIATVPMEGFDEKRVKKILKIPSHCTVPIIIPFGYTEQKELSKSRLPLEFATHYEKW